MSALRRTNYPRPQGNPKSPVVAAIFQRIHERGYTYPSVAARAGVGDRHLSRIAQGLANPGIDIVERLAAAVGLQIIIVPANSI